MLRFHLSFDFDGPWDALVKLINEHGDLGEFFSTPGVEIAEAELGYSKEYKEKAFPSVKQYETMEENDEKWLPLKKNL